MNKLKGMALLVFSLVMVFCISGIVYASEVDTSDNDRKVVESLKQQMQVAEFNTIVEAKNDDILKPELIEAYNDYLQQNAIDSINDINTIIEFVDYAVDKGMIEDTVEVQNAITKALVRLSFKAVVTGGRVLAYGFAAELLDHSLQDNPARMSYIRGSTRSNQIENSNEFKQLIRNIKSQLDKMTKDIWTQTGSTTLNSTTDLFLALNKVSYTAGAEKINGTWTIYIRFSDTYDFEYQDWMSAPGVSGNMATALNNYGAYANSIGAIVSYNIEIYTSEIY